MHSAEDVRFFNLDAFLLVRPVIEPFQFHGPINAGNSIFVTCYVSKGDLPIKIKWYHNDHHVNNHSHGISCSQFGHQANILTINIVGKHHHGEYTCVATNSVGKASYSAELYVNGIFSSRFI